MAILSHNYQDLFTQVTNLIKNEKLTSGLFSIDKNHGLSNYLKIIKNMDMMFQRLVIMFMKTFLEKLDFEFKESPGRTKTYHVKSYHKRSIMTVFGLVTYERTFYSNKHSGESYCHVDSLLGLKKHDHFDPYVKALVVEASCDNSFAAAGRQVSAIIGERVHLDRRMPHISRQTARTFTRESIISKTSPCRRERTPETLYIMFDEKFIPTQNNDGRDVMVRHAVVFEDINPVKNHKNRYELVNKHVMASVETGFNNEILDYIYDTYDIEVIKRIYVLGDGAGWIKNSAREFRLEGNEVFFALDKYHFKQALRLITLNDDLSTVALEYILDDDRKLFDVLCETVVADNDHRKDTIIEKRDYILKNWPAIRLSYHDNLRCCMEGQISHNIAALFTARPKGYSPQTVSKLLKTRIAFCNGLSIKRLFLNNFNCSEEKIIGKKHCDYSIFDFRDEKSHPRIGCYHSFDLNRVSF